MREESLNMRGTDVLLLSAISFLCVSAVTSAQVVGVSRLPVQVTPVQAPLTVVPGGVYDLHFPTTYPEAGKPLRLDSSLPSVRIEPLPEASDGSLRGRLTVDNDARIGTVEISLGQGEREESLSIAVVRPPPPPPEASLGDGGDGGSDDEDSGDEYGNADEDDEATKGQSEWPKAALVAIGLIVGIVVTSLWKRRS
jgi:hypothetical protein